MKHRHETALRALMDHSSGNSRMSDQIMLVRPLPNFPAEHLVLMTHVRVLRILKMGIHLCKFSSLRPYPLASWCSPTRRC